MRSLRAGVSIALGLFAHASLLHAQVGTSASKGTLALSDQQVSELLTRICEARKIPGIAVSIVDARGGRVVTVGVADRVSGRPVTDRTQFDLGSITKPLTATLLARLGEQGALSLQQPLSRVLKTGTNKAGQSPTLLQLMTHTSGLPRLPLTVGMIKGTTIHPHDPYKDIGVDAIESYLTNWTPPDDLPASFAYSNLGYAYLGLVAERVTGRPLFELLRQHVLQPAGMERATFDVTPERAVGVHASGRMARPWNMGAFSAAGALRADARDMVKLLEALVATRLPFRASDFEPIALRTQGRPLRQIANGWMLTDDDVDSIVWHNGGTGGFRSWLSFSRRSGIGVAVLANSAASVDDVGLHLMRPRRQLSLDQQREPLDWLAPALSFAVVLPWLLQRRTLGRFFPWIKPSDIARSRSQVALAIAASAGWLTWLLGIAGWLTWPAWLRPLIVLFALAAWIVAFGKAAATQPSTGPPKPVARRLRMVTNALSALLAWTLAYGAWG